ncbi:response regulator [Haloarchaeobius sp. TZWWS8]|uniref:response regulator n=1 Tax=Haloarchaeobius sp. TZWWS8 TaxID=3446121 RepID=UPI003EBCF104
MSPTVVIADDDEDLRVTLEIWLRETGSTIIPTADGREALEALDENVDVLLVDRRMPVLSGDEVVKQLEETPFEGRVIAISAHPPNDHLNETDVDDYLVKPLYQDDLVDTIQRHAT